MIFLQVGTVGTWAHIITIHPRIAHKLDQVLVTIIVFCQDYQVIATHIALVFLLVLLATMSHIHLATDDRLERFQSFLLSTLVDLSTIVGQFLDAKHDTMIGHCHTLHTVLDSLIDKMRNLRLTIKNGVLRMDV